jgi:hypothetical protein
VAYELELPEGSRSTTPSMYPASRRLWDNRSPLQENIPPLDEEGKLVLAPERIVDVRE